MKTPEVPWLETQAVVTACTYQFARMNTLTLGFATDSGPFRISFSYYAHGKTYNDTFTAPKYMEQGAAFPVSYNPLNPQENSKSAATPTTGMPLFAIGIAGSVVLSLLYLALLRGCN
ncbi:DUF3592 domain-containing protein [Granulicella arctica]|uniref:DUF3592 domain-containing protein n=1 Tax=Granulicella arctica TaxID=940613 RepID=UPI0021E042A7|nr:DUF3592 domain-containing protein [Granulicella arctica]